MRIFGRFLLFQAPGWLLLGGLSLLAARAFGFPVWIAWAIVAADVIKDLVLYPSLSAAYDDRPGPFVGTGALVGAVGRVETRLAPQGSVRIGAERWRAVTRDGAPPLEAGTPVRVEAVRGLEVTVVAAAAGDEVPPPPGPAGAEPAPRRATR